MPFKGTTRWLWRVPGSRDAEYVVSTRPNSCTCPDYANKEREGREPGPCKHIIALGIYLTVVRAFALHEGLTSDKGWKEAALGERPAILAG